MLGLSRPFRSALDRFIAWLLLGAELGPERVEVFLDRVEARFGLRFCDSVLLELRLGLLDGARKFDRFFCLALKDLEGRLERKFPRQVERLGERFCLLQERFGLLLKSP